MIYPWWTPSLSLLLLLLLLFHRLMNKMWIICLPPPQPHELWLNSIETHTTIDHYFYLLVIVPVIANSIWRSINIHILHLISHYLFIHKFLYLVDTNNREQEHKKEMKSFLLFNCFRYRSSLPRAFLLMHHLLIEGVIIISLSWTNDSSDYSDAAQTYIIVHKHA